MSVEHRQTDETPSSDGYTSGRQQPVSDVTLERRYSAGGDSAGNSCGSSDSKLTWPPLSARIERTRLRVRVAALERALETSEHRRQEVIDRYERLLAERDASATTQSTADAQTESSLKRVLERVREASMVRGSER